MSLPVQVRALINEMHLFQKENGITKQCITNVQYFYDSIKNQGYAVRAKPAIALRSILTKNENLTHTVIHMVIEFENMILDPSYEISSDDSYYYFVTIKDIIDFGTTNNIPFEKEYITSLISQFLKFKQFADDINRDKFIICDKKFYHNQHDYVQKQFIINRI